MEAAATRSPRKSAAERREEIISVAIEQFGQGGYNGTSTETIARDAGISQPYLFRLFRTKRELFMACEDRVNARIIATFEEAAEGVPQEERMHAMGKAYMELLQDQSLLRYQMQAYAASSDEAVRAHVRAAFGRVVERVAELTDATQEDLFRFFSVGMLLNVMASLDLSQERWAAPWCDPGELLGFGS